MAGLRQEMVREAAKRGADAIAFMAETDWESEGEKQYAVGVAGPMESGLGLTRREKGIWALLIKFR